MLKNSAGRSELKKKKMIDREMGSEDEEIPRQCVTLKIQPLRI